MSHRSIPPRATEPITTPIVTYHKPGSEPITGLLAGTRDHRVLIITPDGVEECPTTGPFSLQRVEPRCV